jgi:hypothetical protein
VVSVERESVESRERERREQREEERVVSVEWKSKE